MILKKLILSDSAIGPYGEEYQQLALSFVDNGSERVFFIIFELGATPENVALGLRDCAMKLMDGPE